jgi:hypothetical protein
MTALECPTALKITKIWLLPQNSFKIQKRAISAWERELGQA